MALKKGYTTGVHSSFAFKSALDIFLNTFELTITKTIKIDNDDLDVTKGCVIVVSISFDKKQLSLNSIYQKPYILKNKNISLYLYAGVGVGVVTKDGLKPPKNYPAINPVPLKAIEDIFQSKLLDNIPNPIYCTIGVENGEQIAKDTANSKVGVIGGISILGTTGWVKPISSSAYINSIETELDFALANRYKSVVFTLGNSSLKKAKEIYKDSYIIEIGNFIYDGISLAVNRKFDNIILVCGIAKAVKISQGFKNTHNRFGSIDFVALQELVDVDISDTLTVKRVCELLDDDKQKEFVSKIESIVKREFYDWFATNNIDLYIV